MKLKTNTTLKRFLLLASLTDDINAEMFAEYPVNYIIKDRFKKIKAPDSIWEVKFKNFIRASKEAGNVFKSVNFLSKLLDVKNKIIENQKILRIIPLYLFYQNGMIDVLNRFNKVSEELPVSNTTVKDMDEFGLTNIVARLTGNRIELNDFVYNLTTLEVYIEFRRSIFQQLNEIAANKPKYDKNT